MIKPKKRGVKPLIENRSLSFAEVKQRQRAKDKILNDEMWRHDCVPMKVYIHTKQIELLSKVSYEAGIGQFSISDPTNLSAYIFKLIDEDLQAKGVFDKALPKRSLYKEIWQLANSTYTQWKIDHIETLKLNSEAQ
jgi:hypothetical protein